MRECPRCERCYADEVVTCPEEGVNTKQTLPGGTVLANRYILEKRLGRGAMGQVYLARDQNLTTRRVAVKTVRPDILSDSDMQEGEAIARFEREAKTAASIRHPNVVDVTDFGKTDDGVFFLVMEYVEGETLYHLLRREGTLSAERTLSILRQVVAGVEAAHEEGILHRDLKPANIFIMQKRKKGRSESASVDGFIKVGDFGLAKIVSETVSEIDSAGGPASRGIIGTPEYMAPEQMQTGMQLDARADVYAVGTIAYHMLVGRPPFTGDLTQLIMQKVMQTPQPLTSIRADISPVIERTVMRALAREREERPSSVLEWLEEFESAIEKSSEKEEESESRLVIVAPNGAEIYIDDERYGSIGRSGRLILSSVPPGRHVLRVAREGDLDDERVIEIRPDSSDQIIQAQLKPKASGSQPSSRGSGIGSGPPASLPGIVMCAQCSSRFASGVKFCGRCGGTIFLPVQLDSPATPPFREPISPNIQEVQCPRCGVRYPAGTKFCGRCGTVIHAPGGHGVQPEAVSGLNPSPPRGVSCPTCATLYPGGTRFCGRCGTSIGV